MRVAIQIEPEALIQYCALKALINQKSVKLLVSRQLLDIMSLRQAALPKLDVFRAHINQKPAQLHVCPLPLISM
jgi:hypothetical protein